MKHSPIVVLLVAAATMTCGESLEPPEAVPAAITILGGNSQQGVVGQALPDSFVVRVLDAESRPIARWQVRFHEPPDATSATVSPTVVTTDAQGRAAARGVMGTTPGEWRFDAQVADRLGRIVSAELLATAAAGPPSGMAAVRGTEQQGRVGLPLADSLVVRAEDQFKNPVAGTEVVWAAFGGGSVSAASSVTGLDGLAAVQRTLGSASGSQGATAAIAGIGGSPVTFHHLAVVGDASALVTVAGSGQSGPVGKPLPVRSVVRIVDPYGNPIPDQMVSWSAGHGGSADPALVPTDAEGLASTAWTLGGTLGEQTLAATAVGLPGVTLTASATPGPPAQVAIIRQPPISAVNGVPFERKPQVELRDSYGNRSPANGVKIAAELATGAGASLGGTLSVNTAGGLATFANLQLSGAPGSYTLRFTSANLSSDPSAPVSLVAGATASIAILVQPSASAAGQPFAPQPALAVRDAGGNLLSGVPVTASIQSGGGTLSGVTIVPTVDGVATYRALAIGGTSGPRTLRFSAGPAEVVSEEIFITAPPEASAGSWSPVMSSPIVAIHMHLLPDGLVLMFGSGSEPQLWNPATGQFTEAPSPANLFCSGHTFLPDGRLLVVGGHITDGHGLPAATLFDYRTKAWTSGPPMAKGRWYPSATTLPNGDVLTVAGGDEDGLDVPIPEVWTAGETWRQLGTASRRQPYYPRMFVAPNGRVYDAGPSRTLRSLNPAGMGSWSTGATTSSQVYRDYGSAVMYQPGKILIMGGGGLDSNSAPNSSAEAIDLTQPSPSWRPVQSMQHQRRHLNATLLPTGEVLVTGGTSAAGFNNPAGSVHAAELWSPDTEQWTTLASNQVNRVYHSTSLLLPDGRVLHSGSGSGAGAPSQLNYEIFSPPYLFKGARPTISSAPASVGYGQTFPVATADAANISKVSWIRLGSVTHAFDQNQRYNQLAFTRSANDLLVTAPSSGNLAPPGHYLLFILDGSGVPSVARIVQIQ